MARVVDFKYKVVKVIATAAPRSGLATAARRYPWAGLATAARRYPWDCLIRFSSAVISGLR